MGMAVHICDNILNPEHKNDLTLELCDIDKKLRKKKS